jgi:hypothetical protein
MTKPPTKALVTACNVAFATGARTLLRNVARFHSDVARYCFVPPPEVDELSSLMGGLATVLPAPSVIKGIPDNLQIAVAKLFTPLVSEDIVAWLDCDCIVCRPAPEIWDLPPGNVHAVMDTSFEIINMVPPDLQETFLRHHSGVAHRRGFNGGFFVVHSKEWRDLPERYERLLAESNYARYPAIFDQPLLNALMLEKVQWLSFAFNAHHGFDYPIPRNVRVVHFTNVPKPWMPDYPKHQPQYYYWLRYGLQETRFLPLFLARMRIWIRTPIRFAGLFLRRRGLR